MGRTIQLSWNLCNFDTQLLGRPLSYRRHSNFKMFTNLSIFKVIRSVESRDIFRAGKKILNRSHSHSFNSSSTYFASECSHKPPLSQNVNTFHIGLIVFEI